MSALSPSVSLQISLALYALFCIRDKLECDVLSSFSFGCSPKQCAPAPAPLSCCPSKCCKHSMLLSPFFVAIVLQSTSCCSFRRCLSAAGHSPSFLTGICDVQSGPQDSNRRDLMKR